MEVVRPEFVPDSSLSREEMVDLQREISAIARFEDEPAIDPARLDGLTVVGVDQAFLGEQAVSAAVAIRGAQVIERVHAVSPVSIPYIPGLLSFREGGPILEALGALSVEPDLVVFDGSGRIHFRQAGLASHLGVVLDIPSIGVAKGLLCGRPKSPVEGLPEGTRVAIEANDGVEAPPGTVLGYAVQSRQFDTPNRHVNPIYVSPGHRVGAGAAADFAEALCTGYKLPEPVRLADAYAAEAKAQVENSEPDQSSLGEYPADSNH